MRNFRSKVPPSCIGSLKHLISAKFKFCWCYVLLLLLFSPKNWVYSLKEFVEQIEETEDRTGNSLKVFKVSDLTPKNPSNQLQTSATPTLCPSSTKAFSFSTFSLHGTTSQEALMAKSLRRQGWETTLVF